MHCRIWWENGETKVKFKVSENGLVWMSDNCLVLVLHYCLLVLGTYNFNHISPLISIIMLIFFKFQSIRDWFLASFVLSSTLGQSLRVHESEYSIWILWFRVTVSSVQKPFIMHQRWGFLVWTNSSKISYHSGRTDSNPLKLCEQKAAGEIQSILEKVLVVKEIFFSVQGPFHSK